MAKQLNVLFFLLLLLFAVLLQKHFIHVLEFLKQDQLYQIFK